MRIVPQDVTIAITAYERRQYINQAIESALRQTVPVQVIVVENCGPDPALRRQVESAFGGKIQYFRNSHNRGMFDNWNACIEYSKTPWLSILHDDDFLESNWLECMIELSKARPGKALYYGACAHVDQHGQKIHIASKQETNPPAFADMELDRAAIFNPVWFPGQVFQPEVAVKAGGFRASSRYCGDWEMWFKLGVLGGAASTSRLVANVREHPEPARGTNQVSREGLKLAFENVQRKRNLAFIARERGVAVNPFDRAAVHNASPLPTRALIQHANGYSDRMLRYNLGLLRISKSPTITHFLVKMFALVAGIRGIRFLSNVLKK